jgi:hypothetical protein
LTLPNARLGIAVCVILAPGDDESEIAALSLGEGELNPKHRQLLQLTRGFQLAGVELPT